MTGGLLLSAQEVSSPPAQPAAQEHHRGARLANYLNLSPAQQVQAKADFQAARQSAQPIREQMKQLRAAMTQAIQANDTAKIDQISAQQANLKGQISAKRNEAFAKVYSTLTPDQRAKADQLPAHLRQMRQRRMENHQNPSNG